MAKKLIELHSSTGFGRPHFTYKAAHLHSHVKWNASAILMFRTCLSELLLYLELGFHKSGDIFYISALGSLFIGFSTYWLVFVSSVLINMHPWLLHYQNHKVICLWINVNVIHIMHVLFYSLYLAVLAWI